MQNIVWNKEYTRTHITVHIIVHVTWVVAVGRVGRPQMIFNDVSYDT